MASFYDRPAESNIINTYVAAPYQEILQAGLAKQGRYDETLSALQANQEYLDQLQALEGSGQAEYLNQSRAGIEDISKSFANKDLSDPFIRRQLRDEIRRRIDPTRINNIVQSQKNLAERNKMIAEYDARGLYYEPYERTQDPYYTKQLSPDQVYNYTPRAFQDPEKVVDEYFKSIKPTTRPGFDYEKGVMYEVTGLPLNRLIEAVQSNWRSFADTPQGQWVVEQYKRNNPEGEKDPQKIVTGYLNDVAKRYVIPDSYNIAGQIPGFTGSKNKKPDFAFNASTNTQSLTNTDRVQPKTLKESLGFNPEKIKDLQDLISKDNFDEQGNLIHKAIPQVDLGGEEKLNKLLNKVQDYRQGRKDKKYEASKKIIDSVKQFNTGELNKVSDVEALNQYITAYNNSAKADFREYLYETDEVSNSYRERKTRQIQSTTGGRGLKFAETGADSNQPANSLEDIYDKYGVGKEDRDDVFKTLKITGFVPAMGMHRASMVIKGIPHDFFITPNEQEQGIVDLVQKASKVHLRSELGEQKIKSGRNEYVVTTILLPGEKDPVTGVEISPPTFGTRIREAKGNKVFITPDGELTDRMSLPELESFTAGQLNLITQ